MHVAMIIRYSSAAKFRYAVPQTNNAELLRTYRLGTLEVFCNLLPSILSRDQSSKRRIASSPKQKVRGF